MNKQMKMTVGALAVASGIVGISTFFNNNVVPVDEAYCVTKHPDFGSAAIIDADTQNVKKVNGKELIYGDSEGFPLTVNRNKGTCSVRFDDGTSARYKIVNNGP